MAGGSKIIDRLAADLRNAFPEMTGFSPRNLKYMRALAEAWPDEQIVQQLAAQIPWFHNCVILHTVKSPAEREWYIRQTIQNGWSRDVLVHQIERDLYRRQGKALTNFTRTLPAPQSELAQQVVKDPYNFDFLTITEEAREREIERALIDHIRDFLLELGIGFAFVGSQYPIQVGGEEFRIDLLFYHLRLRCFVVLDLKIGQFQPEYSGKMNFYLSAIDDLLRHPDDQPRHWNHSLQIQERGRCRIRPAGYTETCWRLRVPPDRSPAQASTRQLARNRTTRGGAETKPRAAGPGAGS